MNKRFATVLTVIVAFAAIALPVILSIQLARIQGEEAEASRALAYARDVLSRTEQTSDQIDAGFWRLVPLGPGNECSDTALAVMQEIDLASKYIQAIGHVAGEALRCSSLGVHDPALALGPVNVVSSRGVRIRTDVKFPFAGNATFVVVEENGYAAVIHKDLPIDITTLEKDVLLGVFNWSKREYTVVRGAPKREWIAALKEGREATLFDDGYIVAAVRSPRYDTGAVAALPLTYLNQRTRAFALLLVPVGALAGLVLAGAVLYLARLQLGMPSVIRSALRRKEFFLAYQPVVDLRTRRWVGAEALIRWRRSGGEMVRPDLFIPVAEDSGLILRITERVMDLVARDAPRVLARRPDFHFAINLSAKDMHDAGIAARVGRLAKDLGVASGGLILEATERGLMNADLAKATINTLRAGGAKVAIDDFGTGYSSLSYLGSLEVDYLKIDKSFVDAIGKDAATSNVIAHIIEMAKSLHLAMIAEGVETEAQAAYLLEHGVQYAQGWLFAKALSPEELAERLAA
jgi:sensor c-di-GMP phosphodiesterase-like protein